MSKIDLGFLCLSSWRLKEFFPRMANFSNSNFAILIVSDVIRYSWAIQWQRRAIIDSPESRTSACLRRAQATLWSLRKSAPFLFPRLPKGWRDLPVQDFQVREERRGDSHPSILHPCPLSYSRLGFGGDVDKNWQPEFLQKIVPRSGNPITQHIQEKTFQLVRYYGWYSGRSLGEREKRKQAVASLPYVPAKVEIIDVSDYRPKKIVGISNCRRLIPSPKWRERIKKVWEVDPLSSP